MDAYGSFRKTRFEEVGYINQAPGMWRFVDTDSKAVIGGIYPTKAELLADLAAFHAARFE